MHQLLKLPRARLLQRPTAPAVTNTRQVLTGDADRALCWPKPDYGPAEVRRTNMMNGINVAAAQSQGGVIAACTVMFQV